MIDVRLTTKDDLHLPYYSHSIVEAINTCPKWGIIRYINRRYYTSNKREMALEAGSAMHDVFAAVRLWQLSRIQNYHNHFLFHGARLFGEERFKNCFQPRADPRDELMNFAFRILNSGDFYDDPSDRVRTVSNMEDTTIRYVDTQMSVMRNNPVWVEDFNDPTKLVGIEIPFDIVVNNALRYIGTIDGIAVHKELPRIEENKTASRLDEAWRESFRVKSQPTGYIIAGKLITNNEEMYQAKIIGVKLKQTRSYEDMLTFTEDRFVSHYEAWARTLFFAHNLAQEYKNEPLLAPEFTHSCNRYFRPCAFIDLCSSDMDDQESIYEGMDETPLSPSERMVVEKWRT